MFFEIAPRESGVDEIKSVAPLLFGRRHQEFCTHLGAEFEFLRHLIREIELEEDLAGGEF